MGTLWKKFNALGTEVVITAVLNDDQVVLLDKAEDTITEFEKSFSRFIKGNELDKFNQASGKDIIVSQELLKLIEAAKTWQEFSQGTFDPTIIGSLETVGYDRSFTEINPTITSAALKPDLEKLKKDFAARPRLDQLVITDYKVSKPEGLRLDIGGFGKGYIVDQISQVIFKDVASYWISAGGDLLAVGDTGSQSGWKIGVQNPYEPNQEIFKLDTKGEKLGIATSGIWQRQGKLGGLPWHHLIDPRTGLPVENNVLAVTALAETAIKADILAKTVLILGEKSGLDFVNKTVASAALIFLKDGAMIFSSGVKNYL